MIFLKNKKHDHLYLQVHKEKLKQPLDFTTLPKLKLKLPKHSSSLLAKPEDLLELTPLTSEFPHTCTFRVARYCYYNNISFDNFYKWYKQKSSSIENYRKWENYHWEHRHEFPPYDEKYIYGMLSNYYPRIRQDASLNKFIALFEKPDGTVVQHIDMVTQDVFNIDEKFIVVNVGMGGGKTSHTIDYLRTAKTFIWATPNQALSYNTHTRICDSETQNQGDMIYNKAYTEHDDYIKLLHNLLLKERNSPEVDAWKREIMRTEQKLIDVKAFCSTIKHYNRDFN